MSRGRQEQTGISPHLGQRQRQMTRHSCCWKIHQSYVIYHFYQSYLINSNSSNVTDLSKANDKIFLLLTRYLYPSNMYKQLLFLKPMLWRLVIIHICLWNPLPGISGWILNEEGNIRQPFWPGRGSDNWSEAEGEQVPRFAQVDNVEDDPLVNVNIVHWKVEPKPARLKNEGGFAIKASLKCFRPVSWIACIWSDEQIILVIIDEVDPAQITFKMRVDIFLVIPPSPHLSRISRQNIDDPF